MEDYVMSKKGPLQERGAHLFAEGKPVTINHLISGEGGQGDVYHVTFNGKDYALKWYCKHPDDVVGGQQHDVIKKIYGESKKPGNEFIWPFYIVYEGQNEERGKQFGYLMELLSDSYYEMNDFLRMDGDKKAVRFKSYNAMFVAGMKIASAMQKLHLRGFSYKDLNAKNFMIRPDDGDVLVVDNDNVTIDGNESSVKGTPGYMAPEIPRSKYKISPTTRTDYYSLAVVLYRLFFIDHPMEGIAWSKYPLITEEVETKMYALTPVFHYHPNDESNRPSEVYAPNAYMVPGKPNRWKQMPQELKELFVTVFTEGIDTPAKRPPENAWISKIASARDKIVMIKGGNEQIVHFNVMQSIPGGCLGLKTAYSQIALYPKKAVYEVSITGNVKKFTEIAAGVIYDPKTRMMYLYNMTDRIWKYSAPSSDRIVEIGKGKQCPLVPGAKIEFEKVGNAGIVGVVFQPGK